MGVESELYRKMKIGDAHESNWPVHKRAELPWYHPYRIPYFRGSDKWCRDPRCLHTNWGGFDRVHLRGEDCPPLAEYVGRHRREDS